MTTLAVMAVLLGGAAAGQLQWPPLAVLAQAKPPLVMAVVLYYALNHETHTTLMAALLGGLLHDALATGPLGVSVILFALLGLGAGRFRRAVVTESWVTAGFFGAVGGMLLTLVTYAVLARGGHAAWPWGRLLVKAAWTAGMGAGITPAVFFLGHRADQWLGNVDVREVIDGIEQPSRR